MESKGTGKCPKCGSWDVWVSMSKPPSYVCKKCGYAFVTSKSKLQDEPQTKG
jgi:transposase-like protein